MRKNVHGEIDLEKALVESCNVAFAQMGLELGKGKLKDVAQGYGFNKEIPFELGTKNSIFPENKISTKPDLAASAIGQGKILVTPLNMAMVAATIANEGIMMKPILVKEVISPQGRTVRVGKTGTISKVADEGVMMRLKDMMCRAISEGTGKNARIKNVQVAGKTGTAENETKKTHAWFVGFAPAQNPEVAIAVILESIDKSGGGGCSPYRKGYISNGIIKIAMINRFYGKDYYKKTRSVI